MTRAEADIELANRIVRRLPFLVATIAMVLKTPALLRHDQADTGGQLRDDLEEAIALLEEAAGRLLLRVNPESEVGFSGQEW